MKCFLRAAGAFIIYAEFHHHVIHGQSIDVTAAVLTGIGAVVILLTFAKIRAPK